MKNQPRFLFKPVDQKTRPLVHKWLHKPHVAEWFYGHSLETTIKYLDDFLAGSSKYQYWLSYKKEHPFGLLITSRVEKPHDELSKWCNKEGDAITLDFFIGDKDYMGKGSAHLLIQEFISSQYPDVSEVLMDPESTNLRAIRVYQKAGFEILGEFVPPQSPNTHLMMRRQKA